MSDTTPQRDEVGRIKRFNGIEEDAEGVYVLHEDYLAQRQADRARLEQVERELATAKQALWVGHGHSLAMLYGDDGEMQCAAEQDISSDPAEPSST